MALVNSFEIVLKGNLKGTIAILGVFIIGFSILNGTNLQILLPERYDEQPCHFYRGLPPWGLTKSWLKCRVFAAKNNMTM